jgi:hypothetical protein
VRDGLGAVVDTVLGVFDRLGGAVTVGSVVAAVALGLVVVGSTSSGDGPPQSPRPAPVVRPTVSPPADLLVPGPTSGPEDE